MGPSAWLAREGMESRAAWLEAPTPGVLRLLTAGFDGGLGAWWKNLTSQSQSAFELAAHEERLAEAEERADLTAAEIAWAKRRIFADGAKTANEQALLDALGVS